MFVASASIPQSLSEEKGKEVVMTERKGKKEGGSNIDWLFASFHFSSSHPDFRCSGLVVD
jgi:hypothetical protein